MRKLKKILTQEDTILFIGSGVSLWSGLPTWPRMLEELSQFVVENGGDAKLIVDEILRGDLLQAASYGFDQLTKQEIGEFIQLACRYGSAKPHEIHRKIISLGPRCFITTNYDNLIEQSLQKWLPDRVYKQPVTNRHLTEMAGVVHARAIDFVFKPHGDASDADSIILTREQYRQLLPQGERHAALESVKMLLASRPVVYIGFGLRDPDFIYIRDLLANTYKGGARDHYAVMADISQLEVDYWRRNYGIHLVGYKTVERPDKSKDHADILYLLDSLINRDTTITKTSLFDPQAPETLLALARHASALSRISKLTTEVPIRVRVDTRHTNNSQRKYIKYNGSSVESLLTSGPEKIILIGLPGAGKSYALRRSAAKISESLNESCLAEKFSCDDVVIPLVADLKLYKGDLYELVSMTLPSSLQLPDLLKLFKVKIFLDSFNEMPREFVENGAYETDFQSFIKRANSASIIISSRTIDGLEKLELPIFHLDKIDGDAVKSVLDRLHISLKGHFSDETIQLLKRPFYFQYIASGEINIHNNSTPKDFFKTFFTKINNDFYSRFAYKVDLEKVMASVAYESLNRGEEAFPLADLLIILKDNLNRQNKMDLPPLDIANWLVSKSILLPYSDSRISFVHQSVTEYLAATNLANKYITDQKILKEKLQLTRWDQALFLTLSILPPEHSESFFKDVINADLPLALSAAKYIESNQDDLIKELLSEVYKQHGKHRYVWLDIEKIPLSNSHENELRLLIDCGGSLGGKAMVRLIELKGENIKGEALELLFSRRGDFNFGCSGIGYRLKSFASESDIPTIINWIDNIHREQFGRSDSDSDGYYGFISAAAEFLSSLDLDVIHSQLFSNSGNEVANNIRLKLFIKILSEKASKEAFDALTKLILQGCNDSYSAIMQITNHGKNNDKLSWASLTTDHIDKCLNDMMNIEISQWVITVLGYICKARKDLALFLGETVSRLTGIKKLIALSCIGETNNNDLLDLFLEIVQSSEAERINEPLYLINDFDFDWLDKEKEFVSILQLRDITVAKVLLGSIYPREFKNLGFLDIGPINWWLDWMLEIKINMKEWPGQWVISCLSSLLSKHLRNDVKKQFLNDFMTPDSKYKELLIVDIIPNFREITTDELNDCFIALLLADLKHENHTNPFHDHIFGDIATEEFIKKTLLPLLCDASPLLENNIRNILTKAGARHGCRYLLE